MTRPSQRSALGVLFLVLGCALAAVAVAAGRAHVWVVAGAAAVIALWLVSLSWGLMRRR